VSPRFKIEGYQDARGDAPVHRWLTEERSEGARELVGAAILEVLQADGPGVCGTRFGRELGDGVFEFRLDGDPQPWIDAALGLHRHKTGVMKGMSQDRNAFLYAILAIRFFAILAPFSLIV
jgi:hypothetical protein